MRTLIDQRQIEVGILGAILDSAAIYVAHLLNFPSWLALVVGFLPSIFLGKYIELLVDAILKQGKLFAIAIMAGFLFGTGYLLYRYGDISVWENLPYYIVPGILISGISTIVTRVKMHKAEQRVQESFKDKNGRIHVDQQAAKEYMDSIKGENKAIVGEYDKAHSVQCENGVFVGKAENGVLAFKGIPYAKQPVGKQRWKAPQKVEPSDQVFEAYYYGKVEPQPYQNHTQASLYEMGEDCLTLNIWKSEKTKKKCPVMVWIDTYDWGTGGTPTTLDDGSDFVKENPEVLFVSMNFRLGLFGNMDFSDIPGGEKYPDSKNLGLQDQIEALRWIQKNIAAFGGDPDNVTIAGLCSGATAVAVLSTAKEAKGLFKRGICLGGTVGYTNDMESFKAYQKKVRKYFKAKTMEDFLNLSKEELGQAMDDQDLWRAALPVRDGTIVPVSIKESIQNGAAKDIELLFSTAKQESLMTASVGENQEEMTESYKKSLEEAKKSLSKEQIQCLKQYMETYYGTASMETLFNSELITELMVHYPMLKLCQTQTEVGGKSRYLIWNIKSPIKEIGATSLITAIALLKKDDYAEACGVVADSLVFQAIRKMLVNYLKTGDPSLMEGEIANVKECKWLPYSKEDGAVMVIDEQGFKTDKRILSERMSQLKVLEDKLFSRIL